MFLMYLIEINNKIGLNSKTLVPMLKEKSLPFNIFLTTVRCYGLCQTLTNLSVSKIFLTGYLLHRF